MQVFDTGVLLTGASGVGKSELALELLARGHALIADDATEFLRRGETIVGHCPALLSGFLEARSLGILNVRKLFGRRSVRPRAQLSLIVQLDAPSEPLTSGMERITGQRGDRQLAGLRLPTVSIPIRLGHNLAVLVEAACRDHRLRQAGYRADRDFTARQLRAIRNARP
jgi:serine kinase of HPr protein (carbohydrate metabolism regulator)